MTRMKLLFTLSLIIYSSYCLSEASSVKSLERCYPLNNDIQLFIAALEKKEIKYHRAEDKDCIYHSSEDFKRLEKLDAEVFGEEPKNFAHGNSKIY